MTSDLEADLRREFDAATPPTGSLTFSADSVLQQGHRTIRRRRFIAGGSAAMAVALIATGASLLTHPNDKALPQPATHTATTPLPTTAPAPAPARTTASAPPATTATASPPTARGGAVPAGFTAADVSFVDTSHGWAIGNGRCASGSTLCPVVLRTQDSGAHWAALPAPKGVTPVNDAGSPAGGSCADNGTIYGPCVNHIAFANARVGYLWSFHSLFMTTDGAATWTKQNAHASSLIIIGDRVLRWSYVTACSDGCAGRLDVAAVGSSNWRQVQPSGAPSALHPSVLFRAADAAYFYGVRLSDSTAALYRSTDAGSTWTRQHGDLCGTTGLRSIAGAPDGSLAALCRPDINHPAAQPVFLVSTDAGISFTARTAPPGTGAKNTEARFAIALFTASATNLNAEVVPQDGARYAVLHSGDSAKTWHEVAVNPGGSPYAQTGGGGGFANAPSGFIPLGDGTGILSTSDGGQTWQTHPFS